MTSAEAPSPHRFTRDEYHRMGEAGVFTAGRVELVDGEIVDVSPLSPAHATARLLAMRVVQAAFGDGFVVRVQSPLALGPAGEPEPDVAVVRGRERDWAHEYPGSAELVVEIADSSLVVDRTRKAALYARHAIAEYWIVNLQDRTLEVHRDPAGGKYRSVVVLPESAVVAPLGAPSASVAVAALLP